MIIEQSSYVNILSITLLAAVLLPVVHLLYQQIIKPLSKLYYYKKQGFNCQFNAFCGSSPRDSENVTKHGDYYYSWLQRSEGNPRPKLFCKNIGSVCAVVLTDPTLVKEMFINKDDFIKHPFQNALVKRLSPYGLVLLQGNTWKKHRRLIAKGFEYTKIDSLLPKVKTISERLVNNLSDGMTIPNSFNFFKEVAGNIISLVYFQQDIASLKIEGKSMPIYLSDLISQLSNQSYGRSYCIFGMSFINLGLFQQHRDILRKIKVMREEVRKIVVKHRQLRNNPKTVSEEFSMWDLFFADDQFKEDEIIDQFITFFSDGVYTTGHFMNMLTYNLHKHPEWRQKLTLQLKQKLNPSVLPTQALMNSLPTLNACIKEALRLAPPVVTGIERIAVRDSTFSDGTKILKDTLMMACHLVNHVDPKFHQNPLQFQPQRWLNEDSLTNRTIRQHPGSYIPFSIGERQCPGQKFAMAEASIFLSSFLANYTYSIVDEASYQLKFTQRFLREPLQPFGYKLHKTN